MTRSPLFYPLNRGMDADAGGAAELQTDVMRFMAIISLCLVAIFALVQSIPLPATPAPVVLTPAPEKAAPDKVSDAAVPPPPLDKVVLIRPQSIRTEQPQAPPPLQRPAPKPLPGKSASSLPPMTQPVSEAEKPASTVATDEQQGFTLRFESDDALTRLVARNVVGLYAIGQDSVKRMNIDAGAVSFWTASAPGKIHEMDDSTVPESVLAAWRRSNGIKAANVKWGVSIPPSMSRQLNQFLAEQSGGSLVIGTNGKLRLEQ